MSQEGWSCAVCPSRDETQEVSEKVAKPSLSMRNTNAIAEFRVPRLPTSPGNERTSTTFSRDLPRLRSLLVVVVRRIHRRHLIPAARSFVAARGAGTGVHALRADPDFALWIHLQIHVPARMCRRATLRADDDI